MITKPLFSDPDYWNKLSLWQAEGEWVPGCNRTEVPFLTKSGGKLLWCYQPRSGKHAYLDCLTDIILTDAEAANAIGNY